MKKKILIIETIPILLTLFSLFLKNAGYEVKEAFNSTIGLKLCRLIDFDVVLFDARTSDSLKSSPIFNSDENPKLSQITIILLYESILKEFKKDLKIILLQKPVYPSTFLKILGSL